MSAPKFTPWKIDTRRFNECGMFYISNGHYIVAHALGQMSSCEDEAQAHARLIAGAPELYQSLLEMVEDSDDVDDGELPKISAATLTRARQALAKAVQP